MASMGHSSDKNMSSYTETLNWVLRKILENFKEYNILIFYRGKILQSG